ncbi:MAG: aldo/keto reductase [Gaiellaceae bacterium]
MQTRPLGAHGLSVSALGLGCMGMSEFYGTPDEPEAIATIQRALELGVSLIDTADMYGRGANEELVGKALAAERERAIVATKVGIVRREDGSYAGSCGRPDYVHEACDASLARLDIETIDLYQLHRVDPSVPIEETVGAMGELVQAGKVRFLGLSEALPSDIRRAAATAPISTLQNEYSLFERGIEDATLETCAELGIGVLAYAPLGRGMLTGRYSSTSTFEPGDWRLGGPRWKTGNLERNLELVAALETFAERHGATAGQIALAWLLHQRAWIAPIPGTRRRRFLEENAASAAITLSKDDLDELAAIVPRSAIAGERYPPERTPNYTTPPLDGADVSGS